MDLSCQRPNHKHEIMLYRAHNYCISCLSHVCHAIHQIGPSPLWVKRGSFVEWGCSKNIFSAWTVPSPLLYQTRNKNIFKIGSLKNGRILQYYLYTGNYRYPIRGPISIVPYGFHGLDPLVQWPPRRISGVTPFLTKLLSGFCEVVGRESRLQSYLIILDVDGKTIVFWS
jgi:hypothetical protein